VQSRGGSGRPDRADDERRPTRPPQSQRVAGPEVPEDVQFSDLDRAVRARLRTLSKDNAQEVGRHLVMTGRLLDTDPELAYEHAQAAVRRAGRVDVVREAAGLAAYRTGRFAEALRELRTVRRLNGSSEHLAVMADCERGLGRPERALALAASDEARDLEPEVQVELAMVVSGARLDLGEPEAALAVLAAGAPRSLPDTGLLAARVAQARAAALEALGRSDDAATELARFSADDLAAASGEVEEDVVVFDLADDDDAPSEGAERDGTPADDGEDVEEDDVEQDDVAQDDVAQDDVAQDDDAAEAYPAGEAVDQVTAPQAEPASTEHHPEGTDHAVDPTGAGDLAEVADALAEVQAEDADVETRGTEDDVAEPAGDHAWSDGDAEGDRA
jgi:tetratricopeptide (TPR) repeat protein